MFLRLLTVLLLSSSALRAQEGPSFDLEAYEVHLDAEKEGQRVFRYAIKNSGSSTAPAESYRVFFKVNGKMMSFDNKTNPIKPGQTIIYTSPEKIPANQPGKKLKYNLIIHTRDANSRNNKKKGEIIL
ncbi:hypothetical protein [Cyclobacterium jeungdonense]|uniref:FixG C-terminal immunoglobulin-like domain-containing protein n=1 Tax=Cyclobacterium jeungdonense TaxID=708087 RepID=A0ABT8C7L9_9BACT|nr:hypothetical protein [Cyclobacterium jeungdonense]MDN3687598.1 hypothetical protein [Cyclobacterium jeungdonense]